MNYNCSFRIVLAYAFSVVFFAFGGLIYYTLGSIPLSGEYRTGGIAVSVIFLLLPSVFFIANGLRASHITNKLQNMNVAEGNEYLLKKQEDLKATYNEFSSKMNKAMTGARLFAFFIYVCVFLNIAVGIEVDVNYGMFLTFLNVFNIYVAMLTIQFAGNKANIKNDPSIVNGKDYPIILGLCLKAKKRLGIEGEIKISFFTNDNAGIIRLGKYINVQLGVELLERLSEDELYNILLHEFAHLDKSNALENTFLHYATVVIEKRLTHKLSICYRVFDVPFLYNYELSRLLCTILIERHCDSVMKKYGDVNVAASALLKTGFGIYLKWEDNLHPYQNFYEAERIDKDYYKKYIAMRSGIIAQRRADWIKLMQAEIISRRASHPTLKMRLEALGASDYNVLEISDSEQFAAEKNKAIEFVNNMIYEAYKANYRENRKETYVDYVSTIEEWENNGKPITVEGYSEIVDCLKELHRTDEMIALCDEVINRFDRTGACHANYIKGCYLLSCYNPNGVELIYSAINANSNYLEEGLMLIGEFCCLTGNQKLLDEYRVKAIDYAQNQSDLYDKTSELSSKDTLLPHELTQIELKALVEYIGKVDNGVLKEVYCIKKYITDNFDSTDVIVRFKDNIRIEDAREVWEKIFQHLDKASDRQFALFDYDSNKDIKVENIQNSLIYQGKDN